MIDDGELEEWEREALSRAERRFPISKADTDHEFSDRPQLAVRRIRGTYFSIHDNRGPQRENLPEKYRNSPLLIHSEKNRFRFLCEQLMAVWLPEFPEFVRVITALEPPADHPPEQSFEPADDVVWEAESFGMSVLPDCYRIGYLGGGPAPVFASKDLMLGILELVAEGLTTVGEDLEYSANGLLDSLRELIERLPPELKKKHDESAE